MRDSLTMGIVGAGGDGVVILGGFLQRLAARQGYFSQMPRYYSAQIRGGGSAVKLILDAKYLSIPKDSLDLLVCFAWDKYLEFEDELALRSDTLVIYENDPPGEINLSDVSFKVDFSARSRKLTGSTVNKNIIALGVLSKIVALPKGQVNQAIEEDDEFKLLREQFQALEAGERLFTELSLPELRLSPVREKSAKLVLHGNAAIAQGAIHAGCRAFFGYPITPSAEIMQEMQKKLSQDGTSFLQAEDEIASAGMVVGASLAGVKSMTATSGPGLDLMTEMIGLASAAEIPMVIVNVQRCGPSTGIPSKSEQSDLNHALYGGHGDAPRVVLAPYHVEGCYRLAIEAFNIARHFQTPVILLSDQWLGQTLVAANDHFLRELNPVDEGSDAIRENPDDYHRYRLTGDFISPMSVLGDEGLVYQTTGLSHDEKGSPAFDFKTHQLLHDKRWKKLTPLCQREDLVDVFGEGESVWGIITWGSSAQVVLETLRGLGLLDEVKVCVPQLLHPLPSGVDNFLRSTEKLLVVEMNYSGQLYHYLRSLMDLPKQTYVYARAGGRPFSREELTEPITSLVV